MQHRARLLGIVAALALTGAVASAQDTVAEDCPVLDAAEFAQLVEDAHQAILDDDGERFERQHRAIVGRVRCLIEPVDAHVLARHLYSLALVRYADGEPWEPVLQAALRADPDLERTVGPPALRTWTPPAPTPTTALPREPGVTFFVDGVERRGTTVELVGPHVVQARAGGVWASRWVDDGALPEAWWPGATPPGGDDDDEAFRIVLRPWVGAGVAASLGPPVEADGLREPTGGRLRLAVPVEFGVGVDLGDGFLRLTGALVPMVNGRWVFAQDGAVRSKVLGGGAHLAGGGRIGMGYLGARVGGQDPSRLTAQALGGVDVLDTGVHVELRAGVHYTTARDVHPAFGLTVAWSPQVWSSR